MSGGHGKGADEFPSLTAAGLYAAETRGNGDCLFHALSDQLHGDQSHHEELRAAVVQYMRGHADDYKPFIAAIGTERRNPKRKNVGSLQNPPTPEAVDAQFEKHLQNMARGGTYGDNMEIQAFANAFRVNVKIWHHNEQAWLLKSSANTLESARVLHIAYHDYEHYSSVHNIKGPHTGLPNVVEMVQGPYAGAYSSMKSPGSTIVLEPWKVQVVKSSLPYFVSNEAVHRALRRAEGVVDDAVSYLMEKEERSSLPSTPGSSSVEREHDEDDDGENSARAKIPDRHRASSAQPKLGVETRGAKKTLARKVFAAERSHSQDSSASSTNLSQESMPARLLSFDMDSAMQGVQNGLRSPLSAADSDRESTDPAKAAGSDSSSVHHPSIVVPIIGQPTPSDSGAGTPAEEGRRNSKAVPRPTGIKPKPAALKPSASANKEMKKRAQKQAAKERKQEQAAAKNRVRRKGRQSPPTQPFQTLEI